MAKARRVRIRSALAKTRWQKQHPLCANQPNVGSWPVSQYSGVGRKTCHLQGSEGERGRAIARHGSGPFAARSQARAHRDNAAAMPIWKSGH
eukprot:3529303-Pyramimonas_sp.AAC.1